MGHLLQPEQKRKAINKIKAKISSYNLIQMVTLSLSFQFIVHTSLSFIFKS